MGILADKRLVSLSLKPIVIIYIAEIQFAGSKKKKKQLNCINARTSHASSNFPLTVMREKPRKK